MGLRVTSVWTVGRYWRLHPLPQPPPSHPPLCILIFYFLSRARCCLSSLQHILSLPPTPPQPHPALSLTPLPQTHTLTYEHTHSFNLLLRLPSPPPPPPPSTPSTSSSFRPSLFTAGGSRRAVTHPIAAPMSALTHRHGGQTDR